MERSKLHKLFRDLLTVMAARYFVAIIGALREIVIARWLGPGDFGTWSAFRLVLRYADHSHLGFRHALNREIPIAHGRGDMAAAERIATVGLVWIAILSFLVAAGVLASATLFVQESPIFAWGLGIISVAIIGKQLTAYFFTLLRVKKEFSMLSLLIIGVEILVVAGLLVLFPTLGILGGLAALALPHVAVVIFLLRRNPLAFGRLMDAARRQRRLAKRLLAVGFPIVVFGYLFTVMTTLDRWMVLWLMGKTDFGVYSFAALVVSPFLAFPAIITYVLSPNIGEEYGAGRLQALRSYLVKTNFVLAYLYPAVTAAAAVVLPWVFARFFADYVPGVLAAQVLLAASFFLAIMSLGGYVLVVSGRYWQYGTFYMVAILTKFALTYFLIQRGYGLAGAAAASILGYALCGFLTLFSALSVAEMSAGAARRHAVARVSPWLLNASFVGAGMWFLQHSDWLHPTASSSFGVAFVFVAAVAFLNFPLIVYMNRRTAFLSRVAAALSHRPKAAQP